MASTLSKKNVVFEKITRKDGVALWKRTAEGERGGKEVAYAVRRTDDNEPTGWECWSSTQREAGGYLNSGLDGFR